MIQEEELEDVKGFLLEMDDGKKVWVAKLSPDSPSQIRPLDEEDVDEIIEQSGSSLNARRKNNSGAGRSKRKRRKSSDEAARHIEAGSDPIIGAIESLRRKGFGRIYFSGGAVPFDDLDPSTLKGEQIIQVVVDRVKTTPDILTRLTDSIETAYQEGGGKAFAIELRTRVPNNEADVEVTQHRFSEN